RNLPAKKGDSNMESEYDRYMRSPAWHVFRQRVFERDERRCVLCNSEEELQAHHRTYVRFTHERLSDCTTLCKGCHEDVTDRQRRLKYATGKRPAVTDCVSQLPGSNTYQTPAAKELPSLGDCVPALPGKDSILWTSTLKDTPNVTNCQVPAYWGRASL